MSAQLKYAPDGELWESHDGQGNDWWGNKCSTSTSQLWESGNTKINISLGYKFDFKLFEIFKTASYLHYFGYWLFI